MYSLYRAWLSMGPCASLPSTSLAPVMPAPLVPLNLTAPVPTAQMTGAPDVNLQVGPGMTSFSAHRNVLSAHSGFFKAALATTAGVGPIMVPNVNVDEFSSLLTFMYTGYLDLNLSNIYNILLATHILHMPRALEICRTFLTQSHPMETRPTVPNVIKPIASKAVAQHPEIYHPQPVLSLEKSEQTLFKKIAHETHEEQPCRASTSKEPEKKSKVKRDVTKPSEKVIIDIACCDGPVRFHRVINKNYGLANTGEDYAERRVDRNDALNKAMTENIRDKLTDENPTGEVYTCLYCNHTFKSQYCYQKHARRHLNPVDAATGETTVSAKREVKLLDMNVQYYPCKTCGSKFPSYYFVHKHRKLCHAEEMADNNNKNNEIVQVKNDGHVVLEENQNSTNSIIDVEETDNNE